MTLLFHFCIKMLSLFPIFLKQMNLQQKGKKKTRKKSSTTTTTNHQKPLTPRKPQCPPKSKPQMKLMVETVFVLTAFIQQVPCNSSLLSQKPFRIFNIFSADSSVHTAGWKLFKLLQALILKPALGSLPIVCYKFTKQRVVQVESPGDARNISSLRSSTQIATFKSNSTINIAWFVFKDINLTKSPSSSGVLKNNKLFSTQP